VDTLTDDTHISTNHMSPWSMFLFRGDLTAVAFCVENVQVLRLTSNVKAKKTFV
jgi:hypothetical protein